MKKIASHPLYDAKKLEDYLTRKIEERLNELDSKMGPLVRIYERASKNVFARIGDVLREVETYEREERERVLASTEDWKYVPTDELRDIDALNYVVRVVEGITPVDDGDAEAIAEHLEELRTRREERRCACALGTPCVAHMGNEVDSTFSF